MSALLGFAASLLALIGAWTVLRAIRRTIESLTVRAFGGIVRAWRARSFARERRRVKREEGLAALTAQTNADLAPMVADLHIQLTAARAELARVQEEHSIRGALARNGIVS